MKIHQIVKILGLIFLILPLISHQADTSVEVPLDNRSYSNSHYLQKDSKLNRYIWNDSEVVKRNNYNKQFASVLLTGKNTFSKLLQQKRLTGLWDQPLTLSHLHLEQEKQTIFIKVKCPVLSVEELLKEEAERTKKISCQLQTTSNTKLDKFLKAVNLNPSEITKVKLIELQHHNGNKLLKPIQTKIDNQSALPQKTKATAFQETSKAPLSTKSNSNKLQTTGQKIHDPLSML